MTRTDDTSTGFPGGFAVLMAVYFHDNSRLFELAVNSVFANSLRPTQFLLVVDGPLSEDLEETLHLLNATYGDMFEVLRFPINRGLAYALNAGLSHIKLPWVVRADADDINLPHRFLTLSELLASHPQIQLMSSAILEVNELGMPLAVREVPESEASILKFVKSRSPFNHMAVAYNRLAVLACGGYPDVHLKEDYALWCKMLSCGVHAANTKEILVHATSGKGMYKRRGGWRYAKAELEMQRVLVMCGLKGRPHALFDGLMRAAVFFAPNYMRQKIYKFFLRKKYPLSG